MFSVHCPKYEAEVLRGPSSVISVHNTSQGVVTYLRCQCGAVVVMVTGRLAGRTVSHHPDVEAAGTERRREPALVGSS